MSSLVASWLIQEISLSASSRSSLSRSDHRAPSSLRRLELVTGFSKHAEGSVLIKAGDTHVLCNASVLDKVPPFLKGKGQGWVTAEYGMLPRSTHTRSDREAARGKQSGRTQEIQRLIGRSLRAVVDLPALGERTIQIDCDVLQADGGTRCASITGAWIALAIAVKRLQASGELADSPLRGQVAAVSVGKVEGELLVDLDYHEDSACDADINVVMADHAQIVEIQGTAEGDTFSRAELNTLLDLAEQAIHDLQQAQREAVTNA